MDISWNPVKYFNDMNQKIEKKTLTAKALQLWQTCYGTFTVSQPVGLYFHKANFLSKRVLKKHLGKYHRIGLLDYLFPAFLVAHLLDIAGKKSWRTEGGRVLSLILLPITLPLYVMKTALNVVKFFAATLLTLAIFPVLAIVHALGFDHKKAKKEKQAKKAQKESSDLPKKDSVDSKAPVASLAEIKNKTRTTIDTSKALLTSTMKSHTSSAQCKSGSTPKLTREQMQKRRDLIQKWNEVWTPTNTAAL